VGAAGADTGERANTIYVMLINVISIDFNRSNKTFAYHELYLKSADKLCPLLLSIMRGKGARR